VLFLLYLGLQRRGVTYFDPGGAFSGSGALLHPPGKQALPPPGPPQIGRTQQRALPPKK
jgi:hypothetical protein